MHNWVKTKYHQILFLGNFNAGVEDLSVKSFSCSLNLTSLINKPICYKNPDKPSCIDVILTNFPRSFQNSCAIETGLSDFYSGHTYEDNSQKITTKNYCLSQLQIFQ